MNAVTVSRKLSFDVDYVRVDISPNTWRLLQLLSEVSGRNEADTLDELVLDRLRSVSRTQAEAGRLPSDVTPAALAADLAPRTSPPGPGNAALVDACVAGLIAAARGSR